MGDIESVFIYPLFCSDRRSGVQGRRSGLGWRFKLVNRGPGAEIFILRLCSSSRGFPKLRSLEGVKSRVAMRPGDEACGATLRKAAELGFLRNREAWKRMGGQRGELRSVSLGEWSVCSALDTSSLLNIAVSSIHSYTRLPGLDNKHV